jgi:hypothetical protein
MLDRNRSACLRRHRAAAAQVVVDDEERVEIRRVGEPAGGRAACPAAGFRHGDVVPQLMDHADGVRPPGRRRLRRRVRAAARAERSGGAQSTKCANCRFRPVPFVVR